MAATAIVVSTPTSICLSTVRSNALDDPPLDIRIHRRQTPQQRALRTTFPALTADCHVYNYSLVRPDDIPRWNSRYSDLPSTEIALRRYAQFPAISASKYAEVLHVG
jgi:hypothetical protein